MNIKELKKLINEEIKKIKVNEITANTSPGTLKAKMKASEEEPTKAIPGISIDPSAKTVIKKPQTSTSAAIQSPEDFYKGILRLRNELQTKFLLQLKNEEVANIIDEIVSEEIEKLRSKYPDMNIGSKLG